MDQQQGTPELAILIGGREAVHLFRYGENWPWIYYKVMFILPVQDELVAKCESVVFQEADKEKQPVSRLNELAVSRSRDWSVMNVASQRVFPSTYYFFSYHVEIQELSVRPLSKPGFLARTANKLGSLISSLSDRFLC